MSVPAPISASDHSLEFIQYLQAQSINFQIKHHSQAPFWSEKARLTQVPAAFMARVVLFEHKNTTHLLILPALELITRPSLDVILEGMPEIFTSHRPANDYQGPIDAYPPLPHYQGYPCLIAEELLSRDPIYFCAGSHCELFEISQFDFQRLTHGAHIFSLANHTSLPPATELHPERNDPFVVRRLKTRIQNLEKLPAIPPQADALLKLRVDPEAEAAHLAAIIERDPSLSAQILQWASSPLYGYAERVTSVLDAIVRVMGFDLVMNLALGVALTEPYRGEASSGPFGLEHVWREALYTATMMDFLLLQIPRHQQMPRGLCYLSGLLHNFGLLLLGWLMPEAKSQLAATQVLNTQASLISLEEQLMGFHHNELGAWLMQAWHMPEELIYVARWNHLPYYHGQQAALVNLNLLAKHLLLRSDPRYQQVEVSQLLLTAVGLKTTEVEKAFAAWSAEQAALDELIHAK